MNRFDELTALVAVVEHGSFSAAAERLDIAKSAVRRRVRVFSDHMVEHFQEKAPWADCPRGDALR